MAVYKVPQDVEADDKLIGPFSFRQFIYLIIVAIAGFVGYILSKVFIGLVIIPLPVILLFGALALPLRKDQPMETYLVAIIRFFLKPRMRLWSPDGSIGLVTVTAPQEVTEHLTKDFGGNEAQQRLGYLAQVVDTGGWASRGVTQAASTNLTDTVAAEATNATDILDEYAGVNQSFNSLIERRDESHRQQLMGQMRQMVVQQADDAPAAAPQPAPESVRAMPKDQFHAPAQSFPQAAPTTPPAQPTAYDPFTGSSAPVHDAQATADLSYNPYPSAMHQKVIDPHGQPATAGHTPASTPHPVQPPHQPASLPAQPMAQTVSPDIMRLAGNKDLSISAIAHEAHRLEEKEVVISLR